MPPGEAKRPHSPSRGPTCAIEKWPGAYTHDLYLPGSDYAAICTSWASVCGLTDSGEIECEAAEFVAERYALDTITAGPYSAIACGDSTTCGIDAAHQVECFVSKAQASSCEPEVPEGLYTNIELASSGRAFCAFETTGGLVCSEEYVGQPPE